MPAKLRLAPSFMRGCGVYADRFDGQGQAMSGSQEWIV
jgi:hypothetical protein